MSTFGRVALWLFAVVGGYVVVRKYGPSLYDNCKTKLLSAKDKVKQLGTGSTVLVSCTAGANAAGGDRKPQSGVQSSPFFRWCYLVRTGDSAGSIAEKIAGDSARYAELLVSNPGIAKQGKMGEVVGVNAWDFAPGVLSEGTKILVPQTMNAWIDQNGVAKGGYLPFPPDERMIVETSGEEVDGEEEDIIMQDDNRSHDDGFDYVGSGA